MLGRPSEFTADKADKICELIADGISLREICTSDDMPNRCTVFKWLNAHPTFAAQYARAREAQADTLVDEMLTIVDDGRNDWMQRTDQDGANIGWRENGEAIRRSQLRLDARKWMAGKMRPKKYGEKIEVDNTGEVSLVHVVQRRIVKPGDADA